MGVYCEINLHKPANGAYVGAPGTIISGNIKYTVNKETIFSKITVSLKGHGSLRIEEKQITNKRSHPKRCIKNETYIDEDKVIHNNEKGTITPVGTYETTIGFEILCHLPPTLAYKGSANANNVRCNISYYIRIKFSRPGFMKFSKRFRKEIPIISSIVPQLATTPIIYGGQKKLTQLFTTKPSIVNIKANIFKSVLKCGDKIELVYEITNDTDVAIKAVKTKLVEVYKFVTATKAVQVENDVPETDAKTAAIPSGEKQEMSVVIQLPSDRESIQFSNIVTRDYFVYITAHLPLPHKNHVLQVPIQIGSIVEEKIFETDVHEVEDPPSYWEAMNEYNTENAELVDTEACTTSSDMNSNSGEAACQKDEEYSADSK